MSLKAEATIMNYRLLALDAIDACRDQPIRQMRGYLE